MMVLVYNRQVLSNELLGRSLCCGPPYFWPSQATILSYHRHEISFIMATCTVCALEVLCRVYMYIAVLYCTVVHCIALYCTVLYCTVLYCSVCHLQGGLCIGVYLSAECVGGTWMCGVVWCGVVWCGVVWCGVVWCISMSW